jgi:hypothetical protein
MALERQSEIFTATGNVAAEGVRNQLGRPKLDLLTMLIRESIQNSWDAKAPDKKTPVKYSLDIWTLDQKQAKCFRETIFADVPEEGIKIGELLEGEGIQVLAISDRGTTGLGGPTRADEYVEDSDDPAEARDFVDFLRNVGQPPDKRFGGGTFGYGKTSLYLASKASVICVHTHCSHKGRLQKRFIAAGLGDQYRTKRGRKTTGYTGRHWWGEAKKGFVEPVTGARADKLAERLGMPGFKGEDRGTTILIPFPRLGDLDARSAMQLMAEAITWNFWPKMVGDKPSMKFRVSVDHKGLRIPRPENFPPLEGYVKALEKVERFKAGKEEEDVYEVELLRPKTLLGYLSLVQFPRQERRVKVPDSAPDGLPFRSHHIVLLRKPKLVVKYLAGPPLTVDEVEYAGVFLVADECDRSFARSEPPTHDDWVPKVLADKLDRRRVNVAMRRLRDRLKMQGRYALPSAQSATSVPLGGFSDQLGGLLSTVQGTGLGGVPESEGEKGGRGGSGRIRKPRTVRVRVTSPGELITHKSMPAVRSAFEVEFPEGLSSCTVRARVQPVLDGGGLEKAAPLGASTPAILRWEGPDGSITTPRNESMDAEWTVSATSPGPWTVVASLPEPMLVTFRFDANAEGKK